MKQIDLTKIPVFYINLSSDNQRNKSTKSLLKSLGFKNVTRVDAVLGDTLGLTCPHVGCVPEQCSYNKYCGTSESHKKAINLGRSMYPGQPFLVMEDDCVLGEFMDTITLPENVDAIHLGSSEGAIRSFSEDYTLREWQWPEYDEEPTEDNLHRIYNMTSAHAIIYFSEKYMDNIIWCCDNTKKDSVPHDVMSTKFQQDFFVYSTNKPIFWQDGLYQMTGQDLLDYRD